MNRREETVKKLKANQRKLFLTGEKPESANQTTEKLRVPGIINENMYI